MAAVMLSSALYYGGQLVLQILVYNIYSAHTIVCLSFWLLGASVTAWMLVNWFRRRNTVAFRLSQAGIWTKKTDWLSWQQVRMNVDRVIWLKYTDSSGTMHWQKWQLDEVDIGAVELQQLVSMSQ